MVICGAWHSPVVRTVRVREVIGSNPIAPTKTLLEIEVFLFGAPEGCFAKVDGSNPSAPTDNTPYLRSVFL